MERLTYKQAYDKIIEAYFKDDIRPWSNTFCFCGTLSKDGNWGRYNYSNVETAYTTDEYVKMEDALLDAISPGTKKPHRIGISEGSPIYEEVLFAGMSAALDVLKQIHIERGEIIDQALPVFSKRVLTN